MKNYAAVAANAASAAKCRRCCPPAADAESNNVSDNLARKSIQQMKKVWNGFFIGFVLPTEFDNGSVFLSLLEVLRSLQLIFYSAELLWGRCFQSLPNFVTFAIVEKEKSKKTYQPEAEVLPTLLAVFSATNFKRLCNEQQKYVSHKLPAFAI